MARLIIKKLYPVERDRRAIDPPNIATTEQRFLSDGDALDRAAQLIWDEEQRRRKDARRLPALHELQIECDDGSLMDNSTVRRKAPQIRD
jgi:hypothetical protein